MSTPSMLLGVPVVQENAKVSTSPGQEVVQALSEGPAAVSKKPRTKRLVASVRKKTTSPKGTKFVLDPPVPPTEVALAMASAPPEPVVVAELVPAPSWRDRLRAFAHKIRTDTVQLGRRYSHRHAAARQQCCESRVHQAVCSVTETGLLLIQIGTWCVVLSTTAAVYAFVAGLMVFLEDCYHTGLQLREATARLMQRFAVTVVGSHAA